MNESQLARTQDACDNVLSPTFISILLIIVATVPSHKELKLGLLVKVKRNTIPWKMEWLFRSLGRYLNGKILIWLVKHCYTRYYVCKHQRVYWKRRNGEIIIETPFSCRLMHLFIESSTRFIGQHFAYFVNWFQVSINKNAWVSKMQFQRRNNIVKGFNS